MTLDPNAKKAAYDAALPALNRNAAPFHVIDLAIEAYIASRPSAIVEEPTGWTPEKYAEQLAVSTAAKHYPEVPQWRPLTGDIMGLLSQIDNMLTGLVRSPQPHTGRAGVTDEMVIAAWRSLQLEGHVLSDRLLRAALNAALTVEPEAGGVTEVDAMRRDWNKFCADIGMVVDSHDAIAEKINAALTGEVK